MKLERSTFYPLGSSRRLSPTVWAAAFAGLLLLGGLIAGAFYFVRADAQAARPAKTVPLPKALEQPNAFKPLTVEQAIAANQALPFAQRVDDPAGKFVLHSDSDNRARAIECLAQAVYYEAASESIDGQRAVAQVVLNRMRHPGYPSTVCGVVYQGSQRVMGCQFTFTCDGSLLRRPNTAMFGIAHRIAIEALAGRVFAPVGHATNYHADYVLPYWASALDKQVQIGRHIFYRLKGSLGSKGAFGQRYAGQEPNIAPQPTMVVTGEAIGLPIDPLAAGLGIPATNDRPPNPIIAADSIVREPIAADSHSSGLKIDDGAPVASKKAATKAKDCVSDGSTKLVPSAPNDLRSTSKTAC